MSTRTSTRRRPTWSTTPTLRLEREIQRGLPEGPRLVAGMDEVGRGALAGPVSVGMCVIDASTGTAPQGVKDSKLLAPAVRHALVPRLRRWAVAYGVGHAGPDEIDAIGILAALRLAGRRALDQVVAGGVRPEVIILDGNHDWFTEADQVGLLAFAGDGPVHPPVQTLIKADQRCASVAAASVLAKVERDTMMAELAASDGGVYAHYGWEINKGYSAPAHIAALAAHGPCQHHRRSWCLPGVGEVLVERVGESPAGHELRHDEGMGGS